MRSAVHGKRRRVFIITLALLLVAAGTVAAVAASSAGPALAPDKQAVLNANATAAANAAPPAPKNPSAIPPTPTPTPPPNAGQIVLASSGSGFQVPISSQVFTATSLWSDLRGNTLLEVFGGTDAADASRGAILVAGTDESTGVQSAASGMYPAPVGTGSLTLTSVSGNTVSFVTSGGGTGSFDLATHTFTVG